MESTGAWLAVNDKTGENRVVESYQDGLAGEGVVPLPAAIQRWLQAAQAEAWEEGLGAGSDRWCDGREFGDAPVNPYKAIAAVPDLPGFEGTTEALAALTIRGN